METDQSHPPQDRAGLGRSLTSQNPPSAAWRAVALSTKGEPKISFRAADPPAGDALERHALQLGKPAPSPHHPCPKRQPGTQLSPKASPLAPLAPLS
jgi:hypothetical protein